MATVVKRSFTSTPARDASKTWMAIVDLITRGETGAKRSELLAVTGIASSLIADHAPCDAPVVVTCDGPRTRIYCVFDEDAIDGSDANEEPLGFDPLQGDWKVSLPCPADDLAWVQSALAQHSTRITARDMAMSVAIAADESDAATQSLVLDAEGFLGS